MIKVDFKFTERERPDFDELVERVHDALAHKGAVMLKGYEVTPKQVSLENDNELTLHVQGYIL